MINIAVLVTGIGGGSHGEQILKSLKLTNDLNLFIVGTDITENTVGKRYVDSFYIVPLVSDSSYLSSIEEIINKHGIKFVFHGSEPELKFISENRGWFLRRGIYHSLNSVNIIRQCMNKFETYKILEEKGFNLPLFEKIDVVSDVDKISFFPIVLKPSTGSGGSSYVFVALNVAEAKLLVEFMLLKKIDIIAQQYIGTKDDEYTVGVSSDGDGNVLGSVVVKRVINNALTTYSSVTDKGEQYAISSGISQGYVCKHPKLQKQAEEIAKRLDSRGPLNIQCRWLDGELRLFEINPRLSGTTSLRSMAGYNEPILMIRHYLLNEPWKVDYHEMLILRSIEEIEIDE
ncbi:ATP-grasp domain-containing protein [Candidatus Woesearchaeota archaeon]|nr:ATP-grasp domain-containing protein [Candidatus Woesearchaeota archaeon]